MLILLISFLILLILYYLPLKVEIEYIREDQNDNLEINLFIVMKGLGLNLRIPYFQNYMIPFFAEIRAEISSFFLKLWPGKIELEEEITGENIKLRKIQQLLEDIFDHRQISIILNGLKLKCNKFHWQTSFGLGDPASTAIIYGLIYSLKGMILTVLSTKVCQLENPVVEVNPDFYKRKFEIQFQGIFSLYLGNIIFTGLKLLIYRFKGGTKLWLNTQLKN